LIQYNTPPKSLLGGVLRPTDLESDSFKNLPLKAESHKINVRKYIPYI